jgi:cytochrome bd-type quinol oxidase subunit 2
MHWLVARTRDELRQVVAAIGPLWTWHEVWLVGFGGTLVAVFPRLMASAFAGYYLALFLILWSLILRGISLEVGGHINDHLWQAGVLGFRVHVFQLPACHPFRCGGWQPSAGRSARCGWQLLDGIFHRF